MKVTSMISRENLPSTNRTAFEDKENITLQIKKEQLNIIKELIQTEEVKVYKETFSEEKTFIIPINREELVIEKINSTSSNSKTSEASPEIIRIPLSEEQVDFSKHNVTLEDVSIYKEQLQDIKHIEEILKKEQLKIKISGSPQITDTTKIDNY